MAKLFYSKPFIFFLAVILILLIVALGREGYRYYKVNQGIKDLERRIGELKKEKENLAEAEKYLQSEEFLEKEAKLRLNFVKPGEKLIIIKEIEKDLGLEEAESNKEVAKEISNIQKWWEYFFNNRR